MCAGSREADDWAEDGRQYRVCRIDLRSSSHFPQPQVAYNVSKAALIALKNSLAAEWARYGIRVNSISPGYMDTILNQGNGMAEARAIWAARNPMGRMGIPSELTGAVVLLSSSAGTYMNGKKSQRSDTQSLNINKAVILLWMAVKLLFSGSMSAFSYDYRCWIPFQGSASITFQCRTIRTSWDHVPNMA